MEREDAYREMQKAMSTAQTHMQEIARLTQERSETGCLEMPTMQKIMAEQDGWHKAMDQYREARNLWNGTSQNGR